jgi:predicted AlkP superfamily phosphohydrolase/phosphomutase
VGPEEREVLAREIRDKLATWVDEENGQLVVSQPLLREEAYSGAYVEDAPDIIVGYSRGYRVSWSSAAGEIPVGLLSDNDKEWSGDHCMDSRAVPGVILSTLTMTDANHDLRDLSATILDYFDIEKPASIEGKSVY